MPKCAILKVHLKAILKRKEKPKSKLGLLRVTMRLDKSLNQSPQGGLKIYIYIGYTSSIKPLGNCCKVPNKYLIGYVLGGQNGGSTVEFTIDLVPGATLISKTPYRMAHLELKELKA